MSLAFSDFLAVPSCARSNACALGMAITFYG